MPAGLIHRGVLAPLVIVSLGFAPLSVSKVLVRPSALRPKGVSDPSQTRYTRIADTAEVSMEPIVMCDTFKAKTIGRMEL